MNILPPSSGLKWAKFGNVWLYRCGLKEGGHVGYDQSQLQMGKGEDVEVKFNCCDICEEVWGVKLDLLYLGKNIG